MKTLTLAFSALILALVTVTAQEKATFTTPVTVSKTFVEVERTDIQRLPDWGLRIYYRDSAGVSQVDEHSGVFDAVTNPNGADVLVKALNKANLNPATGGKTMDRRALEHLVAEGKIPAASITGTPQ